MKVDEWKPHIEYRPGLVIDGELVFEGEWNCAARGSKGYFVHAQGDTPSEAYRNWLRQMERE